jgi:uncharacterized membrane protein
MNLALFLLGVATIGVASGLRAFTPLALVSWVAVWGWMPLGGSRLAFLGTTLGATIVSFLAVGELIGDKLPTTPSRLAAGPLGARALTAALAAAAISLGTGQPWFLGVVGGIIGSVAGAYGGFYARRSLVRGLGIRDWIIAVVEDIATISLVLLVLAFLF